MSVLLLTALVACAPDALPFDPWLTVTAAVDAQVPTVVHVSWTADVPSSGRVVWTEDGAESSTPWDGEAAEHQIDVYGLHPGDRITLQAEQQDGLQSDAVQVDLPALPTDIPDMTPIGPTPPELGGQFLTVLFSVDTAAVVIFDRQGRPVWYTDPPGDDPILDARMSADGRSVWFVESPNDYQRTLGQVHHVALDASFNEVTPVERVHSGVVPLPEGGIGFIRKQDASVDGQQLLWDEIWERDEQGNEVQIFSVLDAFEPEPLCECMDLHMLSEQTGLPYTDWTHANSLVLSEDGSTYYMLVRYFDGILKIDRATGALEWVLGGYYSDFRAEGPEAGFIHGHLSDMDPERGLIRVFDNNTHGHPPVSRAIELSYDEQARTVDLEWEMFEPTGQCVSMLGDVDRMPDDDMLISWTSRGLIQQVDRDGQVQWEIGANLGAWTGRVEYLEDFRDGE